MKSSCEILPSPSTSASSIYSSTSSARTRPSVSFSSTARSSERLMFRSPSSSSCVKASLISATTSQSFIFFVIICFFSASLIAFGSTHVAELQEVDLPPHLVHHLL
uniref:Uncharacterized protein n=1 Tax=Guillardia theta TaxID=55529 RepID=A0A7S4NKQ8_GUITH